MPRLVSRPGDKSLPLSGKVFTGTPALSTPRRFSYETDEAAGIHLICGEERLPYYRPRICEIFAGLDPAKLTVRSQQWFIDNRIEVVFGRAVNINANQRQVKLADGSSLDYDALVIATGAKGNVPDARGNDAENVLPLRFLDDIERISRIQGPTVIVGDGLLGLEAAWQLSRAGREVTVIGRGDRLLSRQLDKEGSVFFLSLVERAGVRVGILGLTEDTALDQAPDAESYEVLAYDATLAAYIDDVASQSDLVVLLSHVGLQDDKLLAETYDAIDVVIGGRNARRLLAPESVNGTPIVQLGARGEDLGRLEIALDGDNRPIASRWQVIALGPEFADDPEVASLVHRYRVAAQSPTSSTEAEAAD